MKERIARLVEKGENGHKINRHFDQFIVALILLSVVAIILETDHGLHQKYWDAFHWFEIISVSIFSLEYLLRLYIADITHPAESTGKSILRFVFSNYGLVDLIAILPFYLFFFVDFDFRVVTLLRLLRFARLFKMNRYNSSLTILWQVVRNKRMELAIIGTAAAIILVVASTLMYVVEGDAQPDKFPSIGASFYWAISTITALGYGDVTPITSLGKLITSVVSVLGIGLFAVPTGIISSGFFELRQSKETTCPHCGETITQNHSHK